MGICYLDDHNAEDHIHMDITTCNLEEPQQKYRLGWMTCDFNVLFNSISVISGRCLDDNERLCAMELRLWLRSFHLE